MRTQQANRRPDGRTTERLTKREHDKIRDMRRSVARARKVEQRSAFLDGRQ